MTAAAIIMAGGKSERMQREKSLLPIHGSPMIEHVYKQLRPHFEEVLISADKEDKYAFLGAPVVPDMAAGQGPLAGIIPALEASRHDLNFVVACDIPHLDIDAVRGLIDQAEGFDAVVPVTGKNRLETLFAVYRKSALPAFKTLWASGGRMILRAFDHGNVKYVDFSGEAWLRNLNTPEEYDAFVSEYGSLEAE